MPHFTLQKITLVLFSFVMTACATTYVPQSVVFPIEENHVVSNPATVTNTIIVDKKSSYFICSQPQPDATFSEGNNGSLEESSVITGAVGLNESGSSGEYQMDGRTQSIMLSRELLFRLCEFLSNNKVSTDQSISLYQQNLEVIKSVSLIEAQNTSTSRTQAITETVGNVVVTPNSTSLTELQEPSSDDSTTEVTELAPAESSAPAQTECNNGIDDDNDGYYDLSDPGCFNDSTYDNESAR